MSLRITEDEDDDVAQGGSTRSDAEDQCLGDNELNEVREKGVSKVSIAKRTSANNG